MDRSHGTGRGRPLGGGCLTLVIRPDEKAPAIFWTGAFVILRRRYQSLSLQEQVGAARATDSEPPPLGSATGSSELHTPVSVNGRYGGRLRSGGGSFFLIRPARLADAAFLADAFFAGVFFAGAGAGLVAVLAVGFTTRGVLLTAALEGAGAMGAGVVLDLLTRAMARFMTPLVAAGITHLSG